MGMRRGRPAKGLQPDCFWSSAFLEERVGGNDPSKVPETLNADAQESLKWEEKCKSPTDDGVSGWALGNLKGDSDFGLEHRLGSGLRRPGKEADHTLALLLRSSAGQEILLQDAAEP